jgi:hypothetical protein
VLPALQPATPIAPTEGSARYPGWRVAAASSACVLVSFASLLVYTFAIFLKPLAAEFGRAKPSPLPSESRHSPSPLVRRRSVGCSIVILPGGLFCPV